MRVLHYLDSLGRGGAEMQALDVCRNASDYGLEMTVVAGAGGSLEDDFRDSGAELIKLSRKLPVDLYLATQIRKIVKEREIEIVHGYQPVDGIHLYLATRGLRRVKTVLSFQGFIQDKRNRAAAKFLISRMDANIVVSRGLQNWLRTKDKLGTSENFTVIYNGADPQRLVPTGRSLKKELGLSKEAQLIGMVGNFYRDKRKDQMTVCRALPDIFFRFPEVNCVFAGGVEAGAEDKMAECLSLCLKNDIVERVHFLGSRKDIPDILAELDVFIMSSFHEGLPIAISEAMLAGVPMAVSDIDPHLEASQNGDYAEVFPVGGADVLVQKVSKLLADEEYRADLAARARRFALDNFSISAHLGALRSLYESLRPN